MREKRACLSAAYEPSHLRSLYVPGMYTHGALKDAMLVKTAASSRCRWSWTIVPVVQKDYCSQAASPTRFGHIPQVKANTHTHTASDGAHWKVVPRSVKSVYNASMNLW